MSWHKLTFQVPHRGDNKQSVPLVLVFFDETTYTAIRSYYPHREDAAALLNLISIRWIISNSNFRYNSRNYIVKSMCEKCQKVSLNLNGYKCCK